MYVFNDQRDTCPKIKVSFNPKQKAIVFSVTSEHPVYVYRFILQSKHGAISPRRNYFFFGPNPAPACLVYGNVALMLTKIEFG